MPNQYHLVYKSAQRKLVAMATHALIDASIVPGLDEGRFWFKKLVLIIHAEYKRQGLLFIFERGGSKNPSLTGLFSVIFYQIPQELNMTFASIHRQVSAEHWQVPYLFLRALKTWPVEPTADSFWQTQQILWRISPRCWGFLLGSCWCSLSSYFGGRGHDDLDISWHA